jgi:CelD/BcsL family acetyltransferase involved in cellulose biosynthesis
MPPASVDPPAPALGVTLHGSWESLEPLAAEWEALAVASGADVYTSPVHAKIWWTHYGRGRMVVAEVREVSAAGRGALVGVVPLFIERVFAGLGWARLCRIMGGDSTISVLSTSVLKGRAAEVWEAVLRGVLPECDAVCLSPLSGFGGVAEAAHSAGVRVAGPERVWKSEIGVHTTFVLPESFDAYMAALDKRQRGNLRRDLNQIAKRENVTVDVVRTPEEVAREFETFQAMHAAQWRAQSKGGHFSDWPGSVAFSREINAALASRGGAFLVRIAHMGTPVAYEWCLALGAQGFWRLPARVVDEEWEKLGLGRVGMARMIEAMIGLGVREVEAGPGHYDYKVKHGAKETPLISIRVLGPGRASAVRMRCRDVFVRAMNFAYYRVWFLKVKPRLGLKSGALAAWWTRSKM